MNEHTEGEFGSFVAVLAFLVHVTHVGRTAESLKAGLLVHEGIHFLRSEALLLHDEGNDGRVESAATGAHDHAFERSQAHARIKAFAVLCAAQGRAVAEVHDDAVGL